MKNDNLVGYHTSWNFQTSGILQKSLLKRYFDFLQLQLEAGERVVPVIQTGIPAIKPAESPIRTEPKLAPNETHIKIEQEGK